MWSLHFITALMALAAASPVPQAATDPVVNLGYAQFRGLTDPTYNVTSWYSLYYAASPTGSLRWAAPVDIEKQSPYSNTTIYNATTSGPACYQQAVGWSVFGPGNEPVNNENCLLLNVRKPVNPVSTKLPVLVYIHGGGYDLGSAQGLGGSYLTSIAKGQLMFVEVQYRLGGFGFLNSKEVRGSGSANAGLLDQRSALGWVQRHIAAFGGDPTKVVISGGSAGGGAVTAQLQLYGGVSSPPFRGAIAEYPWWQTFHTEEIYSKQFADILTVTGCKDISCLRALPYSTIASAINQTTVTAYQQGAYAYGDFYWGPGVDGTVIKELPHTAFSAGRFSKVPLLVNHDALEGFPFTKWTAFANEQQVQADLKQLWPNANETFFDQVEKLYPTSSFQGNYFSTPIIAATAPGTTVGNYLDASYPGLANDYNAKNPFPYKRSQVFGDAFVSCATRIISAAYVTYGVPVWKLIFNSGILVHSAVDLIIDSPLGSSVGDNNANEVATLQAYFISFATDLNPNTNAALKSVSRPQWQRYGTAANVLYDNFTSFAQGVDTDKSPRCQLMFDYGDQLRN